MASSSRQSLRPSNQMFQHQNRQLNPLQPTNNKSVPAILSRKRKLENIEMDQGQQNSLASNSLLPDRYVSKTGGVSLSIIEAYQQTQERSNNIYQHQGIPRSNINIRSIKSTNVSNALSSIDYSVEGNCIENLPPQENGSISQSASASRSNVGCGQAVSFTRTASQGAYIIPNPTALSCTRVPLATLQPSNRSYMMQNNKRPFQNTPSNLNDSYMEQDDPNESQNSQLFQLYSNASDSRNSPSSSQITTSQPKTPATKRLKLRDSWSRFREFVSQNGDKKSRSKTPFPSLRWADKQEMWDLMCKKESGMYKRATGEELLTRHTTLQPRMRAILFDWLVEVCEVYRLHRETFYLAVDFIDRYLGATSEMPKSRLQLIGVTCLFIAAKIEEIYPPKLQEFAFVTDGACSEDEIIQMELVVLKGLNWGLSPMTPNRWMKTYMQVNNFENTTSSGEYSDSEYDASDDFVIPQYTDQEFIQAMQLLDLVILDIGSLSYKYSVLTASVIYHCQDEQAALTASGYRWEDINACVGWMAPFAFAIRGANIPAARGKVFSGIAKDDQHNIQCHSVELSILELAQQRQAKIAAEAARSRNSPDISVIGDSGYLEMTPPEENNGKLSAQNSSNNTRIGLDTCVYSTEGKKEYTESVGRKETTIATSQNSQISSVFQTPNSDDSGMW